MLFSGSCHPCRDTCSASRRCSNDVFWDNRAGTFNGGLVTGIDGEPSTPYHWDMGVMDNVPGALLTPTHTVLQDGQDSTALGTVQADPTNSTVDPLFRSGYDVTVNILASRMYPAFRQSVIVAELLPPTLMGDYHLADSPPSVARGLGAADVAVHWGTVNNKDAWSGWTYTVSAPTSDIDGQARPTAGRYDAGSDQQSP